VTVLYVPGEPTLISFAFRSEQGLFVHPDQEGLSCACLRFGCLGAKPSFQSKRGQLSILLPVIRLHRQERHLILLRSDYTTSKGGTSVSPVTCDSVAQAGRALDLAKHQNGQPFDYPTPFFVHTDQTVRRIKLRLLKIRFLGGKAIVLRRRGDNC
jgi:hypothetical protein